MGKLRLGIGVAFVLVLAGTSQSGSPLPEIEQLLAYGHRAVEQGRYEAGLAASQVVLLGEVRYSTAAASDTAKAVLLEAMREWELATDGEVKFVEAPAKEAKIMLSWADSLRKHGADVGGYAKWKRAVRRDGTGVLQPELSAQIELRLRLPDGRAMSRDQLKQCALHELGHILGLDDSRAKSEVMSPLDPARPITRPSPADVQALSALRLRASQLLRSATVLP